MKSPRGVNHLQEATQAKSCKTCGRSEGLVLKFIALTTAYSAELGSFLLLQVWSTERDMIQETECLCSYQLLGGDVI